MALPKIGNILIVILLYYKLSIYLMQQWILNVQKKATDHFTDMTKNCHFSKYYNPKISVLPNSVDLSSNYL